MRNKPKSFKSAGCITGVPRSSQRHVPAPAEGRKCERQRALRVGASSQKDAHARFARFINFARVTLASSARAEHTPSPRKPPKRASASEERPRRHLFWDTGTVAASQMMRDPRARPDPLRSETKEWTRGASPMYAIPTRVSMPSLPALRFRYILSCVDLLEGAVCGTDSVHAYRVNITFVWNFHLGAPCKGASLLGPYVTMGRDEQATCLRMTD